MPYCVAIVVGVITGSMTAPRRALFFVRGQLRRSRSAQAVSDAQITNRIRAFCGLVFVTVKPVRLLRLTQNECLATAKHQPQKM